MLDVPGTTNKILLALPRKHVLNRTTLVKSARATAAAKRFQFDLGAIEEGQFHILNQKDKARHVLRDSDAWTAPAKTQ